MNGYLVSEVVDPADPLRMTLQQGKQLSGFGEYRDDGGVVGGCWVYSGSFTEAGNMMARRDNSDPDGAGMYLNWTFAWPANRRIIYNRASCDLDGKPWDASRKLLEWDGAKWTGFDVPDISPTAKPRDVGPFILNAEGVGRLFARQLLRDGPFPSHYEPFESPVANLVAPKVRGNPVARVFEDDWKQFADIGSADFPYAATTYRLTEHFHYWTKNNHVNSVLQPESFVELSVELAEEKGIAKGDWVRVWSKRGGLFAKAVVTKRIKPMLCDGRIVHVVGVPIHWGFVGAARKGFPANVLTPFVGDANMETPEFKAFMVNIEASTGPVA